jgi:hypothetical protein
MIARHQKVFGRGNLHSYFAKNVFLLHKDAFVASFGKSSSSVASNG